MFALELSVNGEKIITAGVEDWDLISSDIIAKRKSKKNQPDAFEVKIDGVPKQKNEGQREHLRWGRTELKIGDIVTICLIETESVDPPIKRYRSDIEVQESPFTEEEIYKLQKETYLALKKKFENE